MGHQESLRRSGLACKANLANCITEIIPGRLYTKVNIGHSGKFMIDEKGDIYGIKAYGVIHRGHYYGNLSAPCEAAFRGLWG